MDTNHWNPVVHIGIWASILLWWVVPPFLSNILYFYNYDILVYYGVSNEVLASFHFYFYLFLAMALALFPVFFARVLQIELFPSLLDDVRLAESKIKKVKERAEWFLRHLQSVIPGEKKKPGDIIDDDREKLTPTPSALLKHQRSAYAFAHEEGFGSHILTGRFLGANSIEVAQERTRRHTLTLGSRPKRKTPLEKMKTPLEKSLR